MKQKNTPPASKQDLLDLEGRLDKKYAMNSDLRFGMKDLRDEILDEIKKDQKKYHNENMNRLDEVMGELQAMREENTVGTYHTRELRVEVDNHEKRIKKIEKVQSAS